MTSHYHLFALCMVRSESADDLEWVLNTLKSTLELINEPPMNFDYLMCDAAAGIIKAFENFFGPSLKILMCYRHVSENVRKKSRVSFFTFFFVSVVIRNSKFSL